MGDVLSGKPLILRAVDHPQGENASHVIWRDTTIDAIGLQCGAGGRTFWRWWIFDPGRPYRDLVTMGDTLSRDDAMKQFRAAWDVYAADPDRIDRALEYHAMVAERAKRRGPG